MRNEYPLMGAGYCIPNILAVSEPNKRYNDKITRRTYQTEPIDARANLIPEDDNPADDNAVVVLYKGKKVGYAPASDAPILREYMRKGAIDSIYIKIRGGKYKEINEYGEVAAGAIDYYGTIYVDLNSRADRPEINKTLLIVCILLGWAGVHRFMRRQTGMGLLYLFTGGLFGIGWIVDIIRIAMGKLK